METYYDPADLGRFNEIGKDAPELAKKFFELHRRLHTCQSGERFQPRRDDRGGARRRGDPGRSLSRAWGADAEDRRKAFHVG